MKPENRALLVVFVAFVFVVAAGGSYVAAVGGSHLLAATPIPASSLPIPAGTIIPKNVASTWVAHFSVPSEGGRLVGAWNTSTEDFIYLVVADGTLPSQGYVCPQIVIAPREVNGTFDMPLGPGAYTIYVESCPFVYADIVITETIQVVPNSFLG